MEIGGKNEKINKSSCQNDEKTVEVKIFSKSNHSISFIF